MMNDIRINWKKFKKILGVGRQTALSKKLAIVKKGNSDYYSLTIKPMNEKAIDLAVLCSQKRYNVYTCGVEKFIPISNEEYKTLRNIEIDNLEDETQIEVILYHMRDWSLKITKLPENIKDVIIRDEICNPGDPGIDAGARRRTVEIETDEGIKEIFNFLEYETMSCFSLNPVYVSESSISYESVLPEEDRIRLRELIYQKYGYGNKFMDEYEERVPIPIIETEQPEKVKIR